MAFTFFFRDIHTLEQLASQFIPYADGSTRVKIWDAGCAMGPEPYTFAIVLAERMGYFTFKKVEIHATDIDEQDQFGKIIQDGVYPIGELSRMPPNILEKYFTKVEGTDTYQINELIRSRVKFTKHDILSLQPVDTNYHLVICKNVLLHFTAEQRVDVIKMYHSVLAPGGMLVTEQTQKLPPECVHLFRQATNDANVFEKI